jgi:hypothetical protein
VFRVLPPGLLADLAKIEDSRNPHKIKHKLIFLLMPGMLASVFRYSSRREAGRSFLKQCNNE